MGPDVRTGLKELLTYGFVFVIALLVKYSPLCDNIFTFILLFKLSFVFFKIIQMIAFPILTLLL